MKTFFFLMALACMTCLNASAQTTESETRAERYLRLSNNADANPADWQAQLEVAHILADPNSGFHNPSRVTRYFERIFRQATDINREIPDSVIREAGLVLMTQANARKDAVKTLYYIDELIRFEKSLAEPNFSSLTTCDTFGYLISLITRNNIKALSYIEDLRQYAVKNNLPGVEHTDMVTALFYDKVLNDYRNLFGDKLIEVTVEGKKYIIVAISKWNIEMPFQGWSGFLSVEEEKDKSTPLFYGDDGKIHDDVHGETKFGFLNAQGYDGIIPQEGTCMRLVSVDPEKRQKMVKAYRDYLQHK